MITYPDNVKINFSEDTQKVIKKIIEDFNSGRYGHKNINAYKMYENYLYYVRLNYSLDNLGYNLVMLTLLCEYAKDLKLVEYNDDFVKIEFTDKGTGIISDFTVKHSPEEGILILRTEKRDKLFVFEMPEDRPVLIFWRD